jgi:hypothetical protein
MRGKIPVELSADIGRLHEYVLILENPLSHVIDNLNLFL